MLGSLFKSKKFIVALAGMIVAAVGHFKPEIADAVGNIVNVVMAYVVGQGIADFGKGAKEVQ